QVRDLLERLANSEGSARQQASDQLWNLGRRGLSPKDGIRVLKAAARPFPADREPLSEFLIQVVAQKPHPSEIPTVVEEFPRLGDRAKRAALDLLARIEDREAASAYVQLVRAHAGSTGFPGLALGTFLEHPRHPQVL